jgi:hypothetical protein
MAEIQILGNCRQLVSNPVGTDYAARKAQNLGWRWQLRKSLLSVDGFTATWGGLVNTGLRFVTTLP